MQVIPFRGPESHCSTATCHYNYKYLEAKTEKKGRRGISY